MNEKIVSLCKSFEQQTIDIVEFKERLETLLIPDEQRKYFEKEWIYAINRLEEVIFCNLADDYYNLGMEVVEHLLMKIKK